VDEDMDTMKAGEEAEEEEVEEVKAWRVLGAALAAVYNIGNDFSPLRAVSVSFCPVIGSPCVKTFCVQKLLEQGLVLGMDESGLCVSALWCVKNILGKSSSESCLGWGRLARCVFFTA
jgi:hypothetical protein